jgi:RHS repeat-associated protein
MATANPFRFSTKFQDDETGLLYYGYRYYDPGTGRWLTQDPLGEEGGLNKYAFIENQPISGVDIRGLLVFDGIEFNRGYANAEGRIGPGKGAFGLTRWLSGIRKLKTEVSCNLCCITELEFSYMLRIFLPVAGDVLEMGYGYPRGGVTATAQQVKNITDHEQVHIQHSLAAANAIFPAIEGACKGRCWRKAGGAAWTKLECYNFILAKIKAYDESVTRFNSDELGEAWHRVHFANSGGRQSYQIPVTAEQRAAFQTIQDQQIQRMQMRDWCSDKRVSPIILACDLQPACGSGLMHRERDTDI